MRMPGNGKLGFSVTPLFHPMTVCENRRQVVTEWVGPRMHSTAQHSACIPASPASATWP